MLYLPFYHSSLLVGFFFLHMKQLQSFQSIKQKQLLPFFLFPSVIFWSSGIIKETIAIGALSFILGYTIKFFLNEKFKSITVKEIVFILICFSISWYIKYYIIGILIAFLLPSALFQIFAGKLKKENINGWFVWGTLAAVIFGILTLTRINFQLEYLPQVLFDNSQAFINKSNPGDYINFTHLEPTWISIIQNVPLALLSGLFRPHLFEVDSIFKLISAGENGIVLLFTLFSLKNLTKIGKSAYKFWLLSGIGYICTLSIFLALSTPNFGTLVRYKSGFLFVLVFITLIENPIFAKIKIYIYKWTNR